MDDKSSVLNVDLNTGNQYNPNTSGTVSSILGARDKTASNATNQAKNLAQTSEAMKQLSADVEVLLNNLKDASAEVKKSTYFKEFKKVVDTFNEAMADSNKILEKGSTNIITLTKGVEKSNNAFDEMATYYDIMNSLYDQQKKDLKEITKEKQKEIALNKADLRYRKDVRGQQSKTIINTAKEGDKDLTGAVSKMAKGMQDVLTNIKTVVSLDKLTGINRTSLAQLQLDTMANMGLTRSSFNTFKSDLYSTINQSVYTPEDFQKALSSLNSMGINNTAEAVDKFNTIIQGQKLLGLSAEQQTKLQTLSNRTGRDSLTFQTNRMAKWMQMSTNIGQKQLSELADINANLLTQFSDIGINSEKFEAVNTANTAALTALTGDTAYAQTYTNVLSQLANDMQAPAESLALDLSTFKQHLNDGKSLFDLIDDGRGTYGDLYNRYMSNWDETQANLPAYTTARGIDSATAALIAQQAKYDLEHGRGTFTQYADSFNVNDPDAVKKLEDATYDSMSTSEKLLNDISNKIYDKTDWISLSKFENSMTIIIGLLSVLAASDLISGGVKVLGKLFKGAGNLFKGSGISGKLGSIGKGTSWSKLGTLGKAGAIGSIAAGAIWAGADAISGFNNTSKEMYGENASTGQKITAGATTLLSGSKVHKDAEGKVDIGANVGKGALSGAGKGALIGAGIGTFFGPGVGTAIGGAIGGLVGGIGGALSGLFKGNKAKEQQEKEQLEATKEIADNTAKTSDLLNSSLTLSTRKISSVRSYTGVGGGSYSFASQSAKPIDSYEDYLLRKGVIGIGGLSEFTGAEGQYAGPWVVTSDFGWRILRGKKDYHHGIDLAKGGTQEIYASHEGKVRLIKHGMNVGYGPYGVAVVSPDGKTEYQYGHMRSKSVKDGEHVYAGTHLGTMGTLGNSTGQHLHYQVNVSGKPVNPTPYINDSLWTGRAPTEQAKQIKDDTSSDKSSGSTVFTTKVRSFATNLGAGGGIDRITSGLADIKNTLIDLSNRQTRDEQILQMLQGNKKPEPRTS